MPTDLLFRDDAYRRVASATVTAHVPVGERLGVVLDATVFYPMGGGQPGDSGRLTAADGVNFAVLECRKAGAGDDTPVHVLADGAAPPVGAAVEAALDWERRYARMRAHTALHLLSVALPFPVTGGSVGDGEGRLDFDIPDATIERESIEERLAALIATDAAVTARFITDAELDANPGLVKTMSVSPPRGSGVVRLVEIEGIDLQPCGGTHVRRLGEIGTVSVTGIEKKGRLNRRVRIRLGDAPTSEDTGR